MGKEGLKTVSTVEEPEDLAPLPPRGLRRSLPAPGRPHRYFFKLYALDAALNLKPGAMRGELEAAMTPHVLAKAEVMRTFRR